MSKKFESTERFLKPDAKYRSLLVSKFINNIMRRGKKSTAQRVFYDTLGLIEKRNKGEEPAIKVLERAIQNTLPTPTVLSAPISPPISSTRRLLTTRPMPVPSSAPASCPRRLKG